ncbi:UNVERIFIED_CONTAM: hypothetical protein FKN15_026115 [Acipenser sinensis]
MDRNALAELLQALESRRDAEERRREERYTALIERQPESHSGGEEQPVPIDQSVVKITTCIHRQTGGYED